MGDIVNVAESIGALFRRARASHIESVRYLLAAGSALRDQKAALPPGEWLLWVKANEAALGFGDRTAQALMRSARLYAQSTAGQLDDDTASRLNRLIWMNDPEPSPYPAGPPVSYLTRFAEWTGKHDPNEFAELSEADRLDLLAQLQSAMRWISQLQQALAITRKAA